MWSFAIQWFPVVSYMYLCSIRNWFLIPRWRFLKCSLLFLKAAQNPLGFVLHSFVQSLDRRHFVMSPMVSLQMDVWETSAEILYWWCVTAQIWEVLLVVPLVKFDSTNQKHYSDLGSYTSSVWNFCSRFAKVNSPAKCHLFSQASKVLDLNCYRVFQQWVWDSLLIKILTCWTQLHMYTVVGVTCRVLKLKLSYPCSVACIGQL